MTLSALPGRDLSQRELAELAASLASHPELWGDQVAFTADRRHFASIHRDEHVDVWLICWSPGNDTGWHDHDISAGAVHVARGAIAEFTPRIGGAHLRTVVREGGSFSFGPDHIHRLTHEAGQAISLHAYSPPLRRLGQYALDDGGVMRRVCVGYTDELRPLVPTPAGQVA